eukprot:15432001-Alexandrium_andersonii.AAC.1
MPAMLPAKRDLRRRIQNSDSPANAGVLHPPCAFGNDGCGFQAFASAVAARFANQRHAAPQHRAAR